MYKVESPYNTEFILSEKLAFMIATSYFKQKHGIPCKITNMDTCDKAIYKGGERIVLCKNVIGQEICRNLQSEVCVGNGRKIGCKTNPNENSLRQLGWL